MSFECNLIISLLKLTRERSVLTEVVNKESHMPSSISTKLLEKMQKQGLVYLKPNSIEVDSNGRLRLAIQALSLGADIERVSNFLQWQEFEEFTALALKNNGYSVSKNVRFKNRGRRREIDIVGCRKPLVICIDCKHWQHAIAPSILKRIVDSQVERTSALSDSLPAPMLKFECVEWDEAKFIPVIVSLMPSSFKFSDDVPIVPILQVQDFLNQLPLYTETVKFFLQTYNRLS